MSGREIDPRIASIAEQLGIQLLPWQAEMATRILAGETVTMSGRQHGGATVKKLVHAIRPASPPPSPLEGVRYVPAVEVALGMGGRRALYRLTVCRGALCYGPQHTHCWYGRNAARLQRKGDRIANRLNQRLDRDEALASALKDPR